MRRSLRLLIHHSAFIISGNTYSRIEPAIDHVRQRVGENVCDADDEDAALHESVVAPVDALLYEEESDAGPVENLLRDDCAREQHAELKAEDCDHGDQPVLQHVLVDDLALAEALGARSAYVVLSEFFYDGGANHAR